jgi:pimeloyl-ACP methyl ester carboxylesterase
MAAYADLAGVRTWYHERGTGEPLVALHPGLVDARALAATVEVLAGHFRVYTPERRGHGHTPDVEGHVSFELMADDTVAFLERVVGGPAIVPGTSHGLLVEKPELCHRIILEFLTNDPVPTLAPVRRRPPRSTRAAGQAGSNASPSGLATTTV